MPLGARSAVYTAVVVYVQPCKQGVTKAVKPRADPHHTKAVTAVPLSIVQHELPCVDQFQRLGLDPSSPVASGSVVGLIYL